MLVMMMTRTDDVLSLSQAHHVLDVTVEGGLELRVGGDGLHPVRHVLLHVPEEAVRSNPHPVHSSVSHTQQPKCV